MNFELAMLILDILIITEGLRVASSNGKKQIFSSINCIVSCNCFLPFMFMLIITSQNMAFYFYDPLN